MTHDRPNRDASLFGLSQRQLPCNIQAEQALLGAVLANNKAYGLVNGFLRPEHFFDPIHQRVFQAIARRIEAGNLADAVTLKGEFENSGILDAVGGTPYLAQLLSAMVGIINASEYGREVHDTWVRRQLISIGEMTVNGAFSGELAGVDQIQHVEDEVLALHEEATPRNDGQRRGPATALEVFDDLMDDISAVATGRATGLYSTGLPTIDRMIGGGVGPDSLTFLVGASGAGKTELSQQVAENVAGAAWERWAPRYRARCAWEMAGRVGTGPDDPGNCPGVLYIVLGNMTKKQMMARTAARMSGVRIRHIIRRDVDIEQGLRLRDARDAVMRLPLEIVDDCPSTVAAVLGEMRRFVRRRPLVMVVIDNMSDVLSMVPQQQMFSTAIAGAKTLKESGAKAMHCAVWLLMHTNSGQENDLRRGEIPRPKVPWKMDKDADAAFGIVRPFKYLDPQPPAVPTTRKMSAEQEQVWLNIKRDWDDKRELYPVGVRNLSELNPIKLREQGTDEDSDRLGKLVFMRDSQQFCELTDSVVPPMNGDEIV